MTSTDLTDYQRGYLDGFNAPAHAATLDAERARANLVIHAAQDVVRDAGTEKWPVNLDRLRMALDEIGELEPSDD